MISLAIAHCDQRSTNVSARNCAALAIEHGCELCATDADFSGAVKKFVDGFNKGDVKMFTSVRADQTSIIDEFPPYAWHGAESCAKH